MTGTRQDEGSSFGALLRRRATAADIAALLAVPVVLAGVFLLPRSVREAVVFTYTDPSPVTAFASSYVHLDATHLAVNVLTYAMVIAVVFVLDLASGRRQRFYTVLVTVLLVFPVVLSYTNLAILRLSVSFGFSGLVMAFAGYLVVALADYLAVQFDIGPRASVGPMLFFLTLGLISALSVQSVVPENTTVVLGNSGLVAAALLSGLLYGLSVYQRGRNLRQRIREATRRSGYFEAAVLAGVLVVALPFVGFPATPTVAGSVLNLYVHLLGYALGFLVPYVTIQLQTRVFAGQPDR